MKTFSFIVSGIVVARRHWSLVLIAWLLPLLPAMALALVAAGSFAPVLDRSLFADRILEGYGSAVWFDFASSPANHLGPILGRGTLIVLLLSAMIQVMLSAGIVEVLVGGGSDHPFTLGVRRNAWPFLRGAASVTVWMAVVAIFARLLIKAGSHLADTVPDGRFDIVGVVGAGLVALVLFAPLDLAYDLSRIASVRHGERSMTRGLLRALGAVLRRPALFVPLYLTFVLLPLALHFVYAAVRTPWTPASGAAVILLFVVQQAVMLIRAFLKIVIWGAELEVYRHLDEPGWCRKRGRAPGRSVPQREAGPILIDAES